MHSVSSILARFSAASFHYDLLHTYTAGLQLTGAEAKSCRLQRPRLAGAFIRISPQGEAFVHGLDISPYKKAPGVAHDRHRPKKLLLHKKELQAISRALTEKGITAVPLAVLNGRCIKLQFALARGKKKYDKRAAIKERDIARDAARSIKMRS